MLGKEEVYEVVLRRGQGRRRERMQGQVKILIV